MNSTAGNAEQPDYHVSLGRRKHPRPEFRPIARHADAARELQPRRRHSAYRMKRRAINELAAILVREHGPQAPLWARRRQDRYAHDPGSELFRLWAAIAEAAARLLGEQNREISPADPSC